MRVVATSRRIVKAGRAAKSESEIEPSTSLNTLASFWIRSGSKTLLVSKNKTLGIVRHSEKRIAALRAPIETRMQVRWRIAWYCLFRLNADRLPKFEAYRRWF